MDRKRFTNILDNMLGEVIYYLIVFMQITPEQIQQWISVPEQFVEEEDCTFDYSVRISAQEFLMVRVKRCNTTVAKYVAHMRGGLPDVIFFLDHLSYRLFLQTLKTKLFTHCATLSQDISKRRKKCVLMARAVTATRAGGKYGRPHYWH